MAVAPVGLRPPNKRVMLHPGHTRIDDAPIPQQYKDKLKKLGYVSLEQVVSVAEMTSSRKQILVAGEPSVRTHLSQYLGADISTVLSDVPDRIKAPQLSLRVRTAAYHYGARLRQPAKAVIPRLDLPAAQHVPAVIRAAAPPRGPLGSTPDVNLEPQMPPIRDQAYRGTCVAHASVAAMENYLIATRQAQQQTVDLSEQFLFWDCKQHDGIPNDDGTYLAVAMPLLFSDGCCLENIWPYNPNPLPGNVGQGPPPPTAQADAATRKAPSAKQLSPQSVQDIKDELAQGRCVAVSVVVFDYCWTTQEIRNSGEVTMPIPGDTSNEGHAICLVGYEDLSGEEELGGGRFILRNSWDSYWGVNCEFGTGYGTLPYAYLTNYGTEAYAIEW